MTDSPTLAADPMPLRRTLFMPWRWHRWGGRGLILGALLWLIVYAVSYPVVDLWLNNSSISPPLLREAIWMYYEPLNYCVESSDFCFALYTWELRWIAGSSDWDWILPERLSPKEIYPWVPNLDGSMVVPSGSVE